MGITKSHREQGLNYRYGEELSWFPSWSNSLWQGWSCGLVHYPGGNATGPIWKVLASSDRISSWTPLKPQHSNPNPNPCPINSGLLTSLLLPHLSSSLTDSLPSLNLLCYSETDARFMQDGRKAVWSIPYVSVAFFQSLKQNFITYRPDCIFEIHQLWQSGCIPIAAVAVHLNGKSYRLVSHLIRCIVITYWIFKRVYDEFKCLYKKGLETYWMHHVVGRLGFSALERQLV